MNNSKILLVEPDKILATTYKNALDREGFKTVLAHTAQSAIEQIDKNQPSLIVLEPSMPRHNGIEFLYELTSYPEWRDIPVIILGGAEVEKLARSKLLEEKLSVVAVLLKTRTSLDELIKIIKTTLERARV